MRKYHTSLTLKINCVIQDIRTSGNSGWIGVRQCRCPPPLACTQSYSGGLHPPGRIRNPPAPQKRMPVVLIVVHRAHISRPAPAAYRAQGRREVMHVKPHVVPVAIPDLTQCVEHSGVVGGVRAHAPLLAHDIRPLPCPSPCWGQQQGPRVDVCVAVLGVVVAVKVFLAPPALSLNSRNC